MPNRIGIPVSVARLPRYTVQPRQCLAWHKRYFQQVPGSDGAKVGEIKSSYQLTFTCKACGHRSQHNVSKQGYHNGTVLVTCPGCENRHLVADHLKIFSDKRITLEEILREKGIDIKKGRQLEGDTIEWLND